MSVFCDMSCILPKFHTCFTSRLFYLVKVDADVSDVSVSPYQRIKRDDEGPIDEVEKENLLYYPQHSCLREYPQTELSSFMKARLT